MYLFGYWKMHEQKPASQNTYNQTKGLGEKGRAAEAGVASVVAAALGARFLLQWEWAFVPRDKLLSPGFLEVVVILIG